MAYGSDSENQRHRGSGGLGKAGRIALAVIGASAGAALLASSAAHARVVSCQVFMQTLQRAVPELAPQFVRPVIVSRGALTPGMEVRDVITKLRIDGQLFCNGDRFVRFEAKIHAPFKPALARGFHRIQAAATAFKTGWSAGKTNAMLARMRSDAAEFMRASAQRGDVFVSGKVEHHAGEAGDIGIIWTRSDRSFILVEYRP